AWGLAERPWLRVHPPTLWRASHREVVVDHRQGADGVGQAEAAGGNRAVVALPHLRAIHVEDEVAAVRAQRNRVARVRASGDVAIRGGRHQWLAIAIRHQREGPLLAAIDAEEVVQVVIGATDEQAIELVSRAAELAHLDGDDAVAERVSGRVADPGAAQLVAT